MITLLHPSRNRPQQAYNTYQNWLSKASTPIEHIVSIDLDEPQADRYRELFTDSKVVQLNPANGYVVGATNQAAKYATGDVLVYLSDDFDCPANWDKEILSRLDISQPQLLKVDDCLQPFHVRVLTIPIITKAFYGQFGYFWYPEYKSMFCDEDLWHVANRRGQMVLAPELKFPHLHPSNPNVQLRGQNDHTYNRSSAQWEQGKAIFAKRSLNGFQ